MPLVEFSCAKCKVQIEKIVPKMYENAEEAAKDAPTCTICKEPMEWQEWSKCSFRINFAPFH